MYILLILIIIINLLLLNIVQPIVLFATASQYQNLPVNYTGSTEHITIGGQQQVSTRLQYTNSGVQVSIDGKTINASINSNTPDGSSTSGGTYRIRNEIKLVNLLAKNPTISFTINISGSQNASGMVNFSQIKSTSSPHPDLKVGVKNGVIAYGGGQQDSTTLSSINASQSIHVTIQVKNSQATLNINSAKIASYTIDPTADIGVGLEGLPGGVQGTISAQYSDYTISY